MSLSNEDWIEILDHMRLRVHQAGFSDVDERITLDFHPTNEARTDFSRYLDSLISSLTERSYSGYTKAMATLQKALKVEGTGHVEGIEVMFHDADTHLYGTDRIDLEQVEDLRPLLAELESLKAHLTRKGLINE